MEAALSNPTNPDFVSESTSTSDPTTARTSQPPEALLGMRSLDTTLAPASTVGLSRGPTPAFVDAFSEWNNEVFDPLGWTLDGLVDFPMDQGFWGTEIE